MEDKQQKPSSIFAAIKPAPPPAAAPAPAPAARQAVSEETVNLLKQKIDALEKNIISQLDKRLTEQAKAAAGQTAPANAPPPPPRQQAVEAAFLMKMGELERRMEEFSRMAMMSASQMKNIEESKISARREIEDLLKAVREQQKYSELDRQMHDQLEKSWTRVEELEKKLMGFYSSLLDSQQKKTEEDSRLSSVLAERLAAIESRLAGQESSMAGLGSVLGKALDERLSGLEARLADGGAAAEMRRALTEELDRQRERAEASLRALSDSVGRDSAAASEALRSQAQCQRALFEEFFRDRMESLRTAVSSELAAHRQSAAAELSALREEFARQARELGSQIDAFRGTAEANRLRADEFVSRLESSHKRQLEELNARYVDAFRGFAVLEKARLLSASALARLEELESRLSAALGSVDEARLPLVPGVSGIVMRRTLDGLREALAGLRADAAPLKALREYAEGRIAEGLPERPEAG